MSFDFIPNRKEMNRYSTTVDLPLSHVGENGVGRSGNDLFELRERNKQAS
jgi:hypothetical protein